MIPLAKERYLKYYLHFAQQHKDNQVALAAEYGQLQRVGEMFAAPAMLDDQATQNRRILDYIDALALSLHFNTG